MHFTSPNTNFLTQRGGGGTAAALDTCQGLCPWTSPGAYGGGTSTKIVCAWMCMPNLVNLYTIFCAKFPNHQYTIFERKAPKFGQSGCFLQ